MVNIPSFTAYPFFYPPWMSKRHASFAYVKPFAETTFAKNTSEANLATKTPPTILCCIFQVLNWSYLIWLNQNNINPLICSMFPPIFTFFGTSSPFFRNTFPPQLCQALRHVAPCFAPGIGSQFCKGLGQVPRGSPRGPLGVQRRGSWAVVGSGRVLGWRGHISDPWGFNGHGEWWRTWVPSCFPFEPANMLRFLEVSCFHIRYHRLKKKSADSNKSWQLLHAQAEDSWTRSRVKT